LNSFFFWHLTLAHFLTDYPFQTDKLFQKKTHNIFGVIIHGCLLFLTMLVLIFPYSFHLLPFICIVLITITHVLQDKLKVFLSYREEIGENFFYYIIDQGLHIFIIFLFSKYFPLPAVKGEGLWFDDFYFKFLTFLIIITYAYWILTYSVEFTFLKYNNLVQGRWKFWGFLERLTAFLLYLYNPFLSVLSFFFTLFVYFYPPDKEKRTLYLFRSIFGIIVTIITAFFFKEVIL